MPDTWLEKLNTENASLRHYSRCYQSSVSQLWMGCKSLLLTIKPKCLKVWERRAVTTQPSLSSPWSFPLSVHSMRIRLHAILQRYHNPSITLRTSLHMLFHLASMPRVTLVWQIISFFETDQPCGLLLATLLDLTPGLALGRWPMSPQGVGSVLTPHPPLLWCGTTYLSSLSSHICTMGTFLHHRIFMKIKYQEDIRYKRGHRTSTQ